jgi:hypothetical protein
MADYKGNADLPGQKWTRGRPEPVSIAHSKDKAAAKMPAPACPLLRRCLADCVHPRPTYPLNLSRLFCKQRQRALPSPFTLYWPSERAIRRLFAGQAHCEPKDLKRIY